MLVFDQYLDLAHVVERVTVRCCKQSVAGPWQVGDWHSLMMFVYNTRVRRILPYYYGHLMLCD